MMSARNVDLVLLVDASESMRPCFGALRNNLDDLLYPLRQANFKVRFGLVAYAAAVANGGPVYDHTFVGGSGLTMIRQLYSDQPGPEQFFTDDPDVVMRTLAGLHAQGNENTLLALDIAADFPFGPVQSTRRVIAVFTDEPLEEDVTGGKTLTILPELIEKLQSRRIQLYVAAPSSDGLNELGTLDGAQIQTVQGGDGLRSIDFRKLLAQMGKSISLSTMQIGDEPPWQRALFGQDNWQADRVVTDENRSTVLAVGESIRLAGRTPIKYLRVQLQWSVAVDLDLHAFYLTVDGRSDQVYFASRGFRGLQLDRDAGVGNVAGSNVENLTVESINDFHTILFATKIFSKGGAFADYDGKVMIKTDRGDEVVVPLTSTERADWCVIAKLVIDANGPCVTNLNAVTNKMPVASAF
jgi:uncharacterized protein involved in tellurium resistance